MCAKDHPSAPEALSHAGCQRVQLPDRQVRGGDLTRSPVRTTPTATPRPSPNSLPTVVKDRQSRQCTRRRARDNGRRRGRVDRLAGPLIEPTAIRCEFVLAERTPPHETVAPPRGLAVRHVGLRVTQEVGGSSPPYRPAQPGAPTAVSGLSLSGHTQRAARLSCIRHISRQRADYGAEKSAPPTRHAQRRRRGNGRPP